MTPVLLAAIAGAGAYLLYTSFAFGRKSLTGDFVARIRATRERQLADWLTQAGLSDANRKHIAGLVAALFCTGFFVGWMIFGGFLAPLLIAMFASTFPVASYRQRRQRRRAEAADAWPRMIEEIRLLCGSLGRPIPQALIEVGKQGPSELRPAFLEAEREWLISTDFRRTVAVLKEQLADPTADTTCETLLIADTVGGSDVDRRLAALAEDRHADLRGRKDARSKQAGVKFARRFVLIVPVGMALAGMSIGNGRAAYETYQGQLGVAFGIATLAACWWWAGLLIQLPEEERVFRG